MIGYYVIYVIRSVSQKTIYKIEIEHILHIETIL